MPPLGMLMHGNLLSGDDLGVSGNRYGILPGHERFVKLPTALEGEATHIAQHGVIDCLEGHKLLVVNTHLPLDKPEKPVEKRFGIKQADELLTLLKERRMMFGCPAIICGDFNAAPDSETLKLFLDAGYHDPHDPQAPTYGRSRRGPRKVDHILFSEGQRVEALPTPVMNLEHVPPNEVEPSDHLPLIARFFFSP